MIGAVPAGAAALSADPFGAPEIADPTWHPATNFTDGVPFAGADGAGNVLLATIYRKNASADDQLAVLERCGSGPVTWQRTVLTDVAGGVTPGRLLVSRDGTALATWRVAGGGTVRHYSSVRPPGGVWGEPQLIVSDLDVAFVQLAVSDTGDAIATWVDSSPAGTWASIRPKGGTWGAPESIAATTLTSDVAMSATGDAVVAYKGPTPGWVFARYRPAGGAWGGRAGGVAQQLLGHAEEPDGRVRRLREGRRARELPRAQRHDPRQRPLQRRVGANRPGARR